MHLVYITGFKNRVTALLHWVVSFLGRGRSERTTTEQQIFARAALARLRRGAADLVSDPGAYDAAREMLETTRRAELEAQALEEARLTDAGERGVHARRAGAAELALTRTGRVGPAVLSNASRAHLGRMNTPSASTVTPSASPSVALGVGLDALDPVDVAPRSAGRPSGVPRR